MSAIFRCCVGQAQDQLEGYVPFQNRPLAAIVASSAELSENILQNDGQFSAFYVRYNNLKNAPHFDEGIYANQCKELISEIDQLAAHRKEQQRQRTVLQSEFKRYLSANFAPNNAEQRAMIKDFEQ